MIRHTLHIIALLLIIAITSCSSKKKISERSLSKVHTEENRDVAIHQVTTLNATTLTDSVASRTTYTPIDSNKPSRVGNTTFQNITITREDVRLKQEKHTADSTSTDLKDKSELETDQTNRSRKTDSKATRQSPWPWIGGGFGLALFLALIALWIRYRPKKKIT